MAAAILLLLIFPSDSYSQVHTKSFGFGLILGEPTGLTLKGSLGGNNAWDAAIGASWFGRTRIHADYLWEVNAFNSHKAGLYFGIGGALGLGRGNGVLVRGNGHDWYYYENENAVAFGVRAVGGIDAMPFNAPVEFFVELAPIVGFVPATGIGYDVAFGVRFYP
ncbi:MAG TPA: hypothetical protein VHI13_19850 [Candidatus Kapabacteria bacterium]|nr:hypothetical protein [Candidatus Kapabacteria bacterium]